MATKLVHRL